MALNLNTPLAKLNGIGPTMLKKLYKLKLETIKDLLWHFPNRYNDFSNIVKIKDLTPNTTATVQGTIQNINIRRAWRRRMTIIEAIVSDETGSIKAVWFNQPYLKNTLKPKKKVNLSGKVSTRKGGIYLSNPIYEVIGSDETRHTGRLIPVYSETRGLTSRGIRYLIKPILENINLEERIPEYILENLKMPDINTAIQKIHFPDKKEEAKEAKKRFAFEDLFFLQLYNLKQKADLSKKTAWPIKADIKNIKDIVSQLPFELTQSQKKSLWEIIKDIEKNNPMNRLLQGDVGSGKTIVAAIAALQTAENGLQTAFMAPTEILAKQHYKTLLKFFPYFEEGAALLTSKEILVSYGERLESSPPKKQAIKNIAENKIKIAIGTHALIQEKVKFDKLALVIVDEQHRFGVNQRATLTKKSSTEKSKPIPHFLSMSATPIPRTLSLTVFGDLNLSLITELPKDRKKVISKVIPPSKRRGAYKFIRKQVNEGRQVFVICPRIEKSEEKENNDKHKTAWENVKTVKEEYDKLSQKIFPELKVKMIHGKLKEKSEIMKSFADGDIDILVSTSVVEVGIDVPNASIMMIESAERFGLSQLYQFKGRVGRGKHQSYCFLFSNSSSKQAITRLKSIETAKNGFELAEKDLKLRGPGEFLGANQTGMPDLAMKALKNPELVKTARDFAAKIIKQDPDLKQNPKLKEILSKFQEEVHRE